MKLSEFAASLDQQILGEEFDLEKRVLSAQVVVQIGAVDNQIQLHKWDYKAKEEINDRRT